MAAGSRCCLALSTPAQSLDRKSNIEWQTFVVQEFETMSNIHPICSFRLGDLEKALVSGLSGLMAGLS